MCYSWTIKFSMECITEFKFTICYFKPNSCAQNDFTVLSEEDIVIDCRLGTIPEQLCGD